MSFSSESNPSRKKKSPQSSSQPCVRKKNNKTQTESFIQWTITQINIGVIWSLSKQNPFKSWRKGTWIFNFDQKFNSFATSFCAAKYWKIKNLFFEGPVNFRIMLKVKILVQNQVFLLINIFLKKFLIGNFALFWNVKPTKPVGINKYKPYYSAKWVFYYIGSEKYFPSVFLNILYNFT